MGIRSSRKYSDEFKRQALDLANKIGPTEAARKLGIRDTNLHNWRRKAGLPLFTKTPASIAESEAEELRRLRKENLDLKKANTILKSAAAFFSQDHLK